MVVAQHTLAEQQANGSSTLEQPAWLDRSDYPFHSRYLAIDGHRIHYIDEGAGPLLLFLHANPLWSFQYRKIIASLRKRFRCVALDYPGFGLSRARAEYVNTLPGNSALVQRFIEHLRLTEITLVAHDASVSIGMGVVVRRPEWFRGLVISNGFAWPLTEDPAIYKFIQVVTSRAVRFMVVNFNLLARYTAANLKVSKSAQRAYLMPFADKRQRRHQHDLFRSIVNDQAYLLGIKRSLPRLRDLPVLLAFADADPTYKAGWLQRYEEIFPKHHSVKIVGSHHFPQEYDPTAIIRAIEGWWEQGHEKVG